MAGLPLLKLSSLLIKTISKPLATRLKFEASRFPSFHKVASKIGQSSHYFSSRINVFASGYKFLGVKPLSAEEALQIGVSYLADGIIIGIGATIIIVEYKRGETNNKIKAEKAALKEEAERIALEQRFADIEERINDIELSLPANQQAKINNLKKVHRIDHEILASKIMQEKELKAEIEKANLNEIKMAELLEQREEAEKAEKIHDICSNLDNLEIINSLGIIKRPDAK